MERPALFLNQNKLVDFSSCRLAWESKLMDVSKMLAELRQEREAIEEAIQILERLARGRGKRRGRPPLWMTSGEAPVRRRGRPPGSKNKPKESASSD